MERWLLLIACIALLGGVGLVEARTFTDDRGRQIEADLLGVNGANVVLEKNGQAAQWPIAKLSQPDQMYVKAWLTDPPSNPRIGVRIWEREGIGQSGRFGEKESGPSLPKNIPMLKKTEEKEKYRYYDMDLTNSSAVDAKELHLSYVLYVIDASNQVVDFSGSQKVETIPAGKRETRTTEAVTTTRTKTTSLTLGIGALGNLSAGTSTDRAKERFGGAWVRVYGKDGELLGEAKQLHDELERLDLRFTGSTSGGFADVPILETFDKLKELFESLPKLPENLPKPPGGLPDLPKPPGGLPKPPFSKP